MPPRTTATCFLLPLCFHGLTNCFSRNPFLFKTICVARGCGGYLLEMPPAPLCVLCVAVANPFLSSICGLFISLCAPQKSQPLCNQSNPDSFCKTPGVGGYPE